MIRDIPALVDNADMLAIGGFDRVHAPAIMPGGVTRSLIDRPPVPTLPNH